jgi:hypothetical protein
MEGDRFVGGNPLQRLIQFVKRNIVGDVPEAIALCEFDCRRGQCIQGEWAACDRRIRKASGELFPDGDGAGQP